LIFFKRSSEKVPQDPPPGLFALPFTLRFAVGAVVPMPTKPWVFMRKFLLLLLESSAVNSRAVPEPVPNCRRTHARSVPRCKSLAPSPVATIDSLADGVVVPMPTFVLEREPLTPLILPSTSELLARFFQIARMASAGLAWMLKTITAQWRYSRMRWQPCPRERCPDKA